jgi:hypothetical protein
VFFALLGVFTKKGSFVWAALAKKLPIGLFVVGEKQQQR